MRRDAEAVVEGLRDDGLPITKVEVYTAKTDPNDLLGRPDGYTSKVNFTTSGQLLRASVGV